MFRMHFCGIIKKAGMLLKLPQVCIGLATSIFHRFYYKKSFVRCDGFIMASACLYLATKLEEQPRKL